MALCVAVLLQSFVFARKNSGKRDTCGVNKLNRGTIESAVNGQNCLVLEAFQLRKAPVILKQPAPVMPQQPRAALRPIVVPVGGAPFAEITANQPKASAFLCDDGWLAARSAALGPTQRDDVEVSATLQERANNLTKHLVHRLYRHLQVRVKESSRSHPIVRWIAQNLPRVAADLTLRGVVVDDMLEPQNLSICLISSHTAKYNNIVPANEEHEGCYLCFDSNRQIWVRSGKVCGLSTNFRTRIAQHAKASSGGTSRFYTSYPSPEAVCHLPFVPRSP